MDAFFAAVEVLDDPALAGQPVIVGGLAARGVVSTASYEARALGVHSGQPMAAARRLAPGAVFRAPRLARYREISGRLMEIFRRHTPLVEPLSLDEAFLDVSGSERLFGPPEALARRLKAEVRRATGLTASAGVAGLKFLAKMASSRDKPDGLTVVPPGGELDFLRPLPLRDLWGVGPATLARLSALGLATVGDLAAQDRELLAREFGQAGQRPWPLANARDDRAVEPRREAKSVGAEATFAVDLAAPEDIRAALLAQTLAAVERLRGQGLKAGGVTVKFRDHRFRTWTRGRALAAPTDLREEIYQEVLDIYEKEAPSPGPFRLLGVTLGRLSARGAPEAPGLWEPVPGAARERAARLNAALDQINSRFGAGALKPASLAVPPNVRRERGGAKNEGDS
jgi:DNA polymerase-4